MEIVEGLEKDFSHHQIHCDLNSKELVASFANAVHGSRNRKSGPPGEPSSELWRILLCHQWTIPGFQVKWGDWN
eukprot:5758414-Karenia_brevis.AAC.1